MKNILKWIIKILFRMSLIVIGSGLFASLLFASFSFGVKAQKAAILPNPDLLGPVFFEQNKDKTVLLYKKKGDAAYGGSGSIIEFNGHKYVVTNEHVCQIAVELYNPQEFNELKLNAIFENGLRTELKIKYMSRDADVCLLEAPANRDGFKLALTYSIGEYVEAFGHPKLGPLTLSPGNLIQAEIIEVTGELSPACLGSHNARVEAGYCLISRRVIQSNMVIKPGSSGSPTLNLKGEVVGLVTAGRDDVENVSYITPVDDIYNALVAYEASVP